MSSHIPDLWDGCYDGKARQEMPPEQFRKTFCNVCTNPGCRNSRGVGTLWAKRMMSQVDNLLDNPRFADPEDPQFKAIRAMPFENMIRQALAIEISSRRGDWSVPTDREIGQAAAEMVGLSSPSGFQVQVGPPEEDEEEGDPQPPERLVDEVRKTQQAFDEDPPPEPTESEGGRWRIKGDTGKIYEVTLSGGEWACSCPSRENPCKHARSIIGKLRRAGATVSEATPQPTPAPPPPSLSGIPESPSRFQAPSAKNTRQPRKGVLIGGSPPTQPESGDPWAPPPPQKKERVIPVGGKVRFSRKK